MHCAVRYERNFACASSLLFVACIWLGLIMKILRALAIATVLPLISTSAFAQQGKLTDVSVEGHIYEPARLPPTDARVAGLQIPAGFVVQRHAEGLDNPRILALGPDGAMYVTQRKPGNVVMLRDVDGDGIADVQRIVVRRPEAHGIAIRGREIFLTT